MFLFAIELVVVFLCTVITGFYLYYHHCFTYWKRRGAPQLNPTFPIGDLGSSAWGKESMFIRLQTLYHKFKSAGHKFGGIYFLNGPIFFPVHPDIVKSVLVSDFDHFVDRGMYVNEKKVPLSPSLFTVNAEEWRSLRVKLTPTFTSGKMKGMYNILVKVAQNLEETLEPFARDECEVDMKDFLIRYGTDIIGSTAFGIECNSLKEPDTEFTRMIGIIFRNSPWKLLKLLVQEGLQNPGNINKIFMDKKIVQKYFEDLVQGTIEYRDKNNILRNDFLNILMQMRSSGFTFREIVNQAFLFFTAGFETSSSVMSFCVHELAHNPEIQEKLREEVRTNLGTDCSKYTYDDILGLPYLDMCIKESMRKYPVVAMLNRVAVKRYQVPESDVIVEEGTPVIISVLGLHRDPEHYPDPLKFDPERFGSENYVIPFTYLPFGDGPRNCIGLRFGLMQTKLGLATLLNRFKFLPSPSTPRHLNIETSTTSVLYSVSGGINVKIVKYT